MDVSMLSNEDAPRDEIIESMMRSAVSALKLGRLEEGMSRFEEILECGTTSFQLLSTLYMWYGRVCRKLKYHDKALEFFEHELNTYRLTFNYSAACDAYRRIAELSMKMGKFSKAKRTAEDLVDYTTSKKECEQFVAQARALLVSVCLEGFERNMEPNADEKKRLLIVSSQQIEEVKLLSGDAPEVTVLMLEAKCLALNGKLKEARDGYQKCIDQSIKTKQFQFVHRAYYEMATFAEGNALLCMINDLRSAVFFAKNHGTEHDMTDYKIELAKKLLAFGNPYEAYLYCKEALGTARKLASNSMTLQALLIVSQCLIELGERRQAAYFIVLGSVLTITQQSLHNQNQKTETSQTDKENQPKVEEKKPEETTSSPSSWEFDRLYKQIDELMTAEKKETSDENTVEVAVDSSADEVPNEMVSKFVVKLEHTTTVVTWRMVVNDMIEVKTKKPVVEKKAEEDLDIFEMIAKMNSRMDDQRTELPAAIFNRPRPLSAASSRKTTKSHKLLPGLRINFSKLQNAKIDMHAVNKLLKLKRSKKSKVSIHSDSTQGDDTRSDVTPIEDSSLSTSK